MMNFTKRKPGKNVIKQPKTTLFRPKNTHANDRVHRVSTVKKKRILTTIFLIILLLMVLFLILGVLGVVAYSLKSGTTLPFIAQAQEVIRKTPLKVFLFEEDTKKEKRDVVGIVGVPEYPHSEFIFEGYVTVSEGNKVHIASDLVSDSDGQVLYTFISSGQSVYRLPLDTKWDQVTAFYKEELVKAGWEYKNTVGIADLERIPGEYYTKDGKGLHMYQVSYDIWYETITPAQAEDGLRDKVVAYKAKQELVAAASGKDLPSETLWSMKYSRDWDLEFQDHPTLGVKNLYFTHYKSKERVSFVAIRKFDKPIADLQYSNVESVGTEYVVTWLTTQPAQVQLADFKKTQLTVAGSKAMEFYNSKINAHFLIVFHNKRGIFYAVQYIGTEKSDFVEYIKDNLKVL